jgi:DNA-binding IclR family transcriptional regulator
VPVRDHSGEVSAALCVLGPRNRMPQRRFRELRDVLAAAAARLSAQLGYRAP